MQDCIFCQILQGRAEASIVYAEEKVTAFMDIQPVNLGHVLVIPNAHAAYLADLEQDTGAHLFRVAMEVSQAVRGAGVRCEGVNLFLADGEVAGQEVFHVHLHVFPRFKGDGFGLKFGPSYAVRPPRETLNKIAERIKAALRR
ncbi:HIT family protein [Candidatus Acetothermia bacterium]|nr:HIT family protein [Candidatus Acetothermia bacterium]